METTARDLARVERRLREARDYSDGYAKLLLHSARKVLAESGFDLTEEDRRIPIDAPAVEAQIAHFTDRPASERRPRSSTATNYAENWRRFARWTREYLQAEAAGEEDLYLHKLGVRAPKRARRSSPAMVDESEWDLADEEWDLDIESARVESAVQAMRGGPRRSQSLSLAAPLYSYPAARETAEPGETRVITVRTSFGPYRMELPQSLRAEDAARIARAVLRLVD